MRNADPNEVYTPADLPGLRLAPVALAVFGDPVKHSLSPPMHNAALAEMARQNPAFRDWRYYKFAVRAEEVVRVLPDFARAGFRGINLTIPHKTLILEALPHIEASARQMGAVNTLSLKDGYYMGFNTDGYGLRQAVREELGLTLGGQPVILLGAGGAARAAAVQCLLDGVPELWLGNRNPDRLQTLLRDLTALGRDTPIHPFSLIDPPRDRFPAGALVINATSVGLIPGAPAPVDLDLLEQPAGIYDMIYNPAVTTLLHEAGQRGLPAANGLSMLVWQGVRALEIWTGAKVPAATMRKACEEAL